MMSLSVASIVPILPVLVVAIIALATMTVLISVRAAIALRRAGVVVVARIAVSMAVLSIITVMSAAAAIAIFIVTVAGRAWGFLLQRATKIQQHFTSLCSPYASGLCHHNDNTYSTSRPLDTHSPCPSSLAYQ